MFCTWLNLYFHRSITFKNLNDAIITDLTDTII
jgi:hypothetical protein